MQTILNEYPVVPKDFITAPIFAAKPQMGGRTVVVKNKLYTIGGFHPISEDRDPCPALDIRHGRALFTLLSYVDAADENKTVRFSIRDFCRRYSDSSWSGRYARNIRAILSDLERCWFKVTYKDGESESYRILKNISIRQKEPRKRPKEISYQEEIWIDEVELHPKFFEMLQDYYNIAQINLKALTSLTSALAQAIYSYIPSRAVHCTIKKPFEITLITLLEQIGQPVPNSKSLRKKIFTQNKHSVLDQLDGVAIVNGVLRAKLIETTDGSDFKILFWTEEEAVPKQKKQRNASGVLFDLWKQGGGSEKSFNQKTQKLLPSLNDYQKNTLETAGVVLHRNNIFFRKSLALLGEGTFNELISDAKSALLEGRKINKSSTQRLIHYIKEEVRRKAAYYS